MCQLLELLRHDPRPADRVIAAFFRQRRYLGSHDRAELSESAYGILRFRRLLQSLIARVQPAASDDPAWLFAAYKLHVEKVVPQALSAYSLPLRTAEIARLAAQEPSAAAADCGIRLSFPEWLVQALRRQRGEEESERLLAALNQPAPVTVRVNTLKTTREECLAELQRRGLEAVPTKLSPFGLHLAKRTNLFALDLFRQGWFELQDEGSQLVSLLVDPKPASRVADACAGGGGKTLHLAALMKNHGEIFAFDVLSRRLANVLKRAQRGGAHNIRTMLLEQDATPASLLRSLDAVLIDAPCSGTGVLRRSPDTKWKISEELVGRIAATQQRILKQYAPLVKPGGRLVYATCSVLAEENEEVVHSFLAQHPDFRLGNAARILRSFQLEELADGGFLRVWPHTHGCDGFFAAAMQLAN